MNGLIVQRLRTLPFHGRDRGSNPLGATKEMEVKDEVRRNRKKERATQQTICFC